MTNLLSLITPTNLEVERDKFFGSPTYNPTFHYIWQDYEMEPEFSIKLKYPLWEAIKTQNHVGIVEAASKLFEVEINEENLTNAQKISKEVGEKHQGSASEIKARFEEVFHEFGIDYVPKIVQDPGFYVRPSHSTGELIISEHIHFEYFSVEAEVHHELVHILRYLNGKHNKIKRSQRFLPTEEGLASWCQDHTNNDLSQVQHAMEYIGSSVGLTGSLRDIYECMMGLGMSSDLAWKRASRHKFGFVDTSLPGDILKPAMYFANSKKIDKLATDEKLRLFVGKINLDELSDHPTYTGLWPKGKIIEYFKID